jgi:hypothetical protein
MTALLEMLAAFLRQLVVLTTDEALRLMGFDPD